MATSAINTSRDEKQLADEVSHEETGLQNLSEVNETVAEEALAPEVEGATTRLKSRNNKLPTILNKTPTKRNTSPTTEEPTTQDFGLQAETEEQELPAQDEATPQQSSKKRRRSGQDLLPEPKVIKKRLETTIKQDAATELLKLQAPKGGQFENNDVNAIVQIYNTIGYNCITKTSLRHTANQLKNTPIYRSIRRKYGAAAFKYGVTDNEPNEEVDNNKHQTESEAVIAAESKRTENDNLNKPHNSETPRSDEVKEPKPYVKLNKGGRPKGSTTGHAGPKPPKPPRLSPHNKPLMKLTTQAAEMFYDLAQKAKERGEKVAKGTLTNLVREVEKEHGVPVGTIAPRTVMTRVRRGNPTGKCSQREPILEDIEPEIVEYCAQAVKMGQPLDMEQVMMITNSIIKRHDLEAQIIEEKKKRKIMGDGSEHEQSILGARWYRAFKERSMPDIISKVGEEIVQVKRYFNLKLEHFKRTYENVYEQMVEAGVAEKLYTPILLDINGNRTDRERAFGLPTRYKVTKPNYLLFLDQVGSKNKEINFYGHVDGQMFSLPVDNSTGLNVNNQDPEIKFSVYNFMDGFGEAVMCAIIMKSDLNVDDVPLNIRWGIDTFVPLNAAATDEELFENNCGIGQAMQGGPICFYNEKEIPCYFGTSETGCINSQILRDVCEYLDAIELYDRSNGAVKPMLLLDGNLCIFDVPFLEYVQEESHPWVVCCGLPRNSHLLPVVDSSEFNGPFRNEFASVKQRLLAGRSHGRKHFSPSDIVPLIKYAWSQTLAQSDTARRALALRGWNPLNYALLLHPTLTKLQQNAERKIKNEAAKEVK